MTGVEDLEAIFEQYYNKSPKGFKDPKSIEISCCNKKSLINNSGEVVCKFCGQVSHYEMINEGFIDFLRKSLSNKAKVKI